MADNQDRLFAELLLHTSVTYTALAMLSMHLPIPVALPGVPQDPATAVAAATVEISSDTAIPAIWRAMELSGEQPMPEQWQEHYLSACTHYLAAIDVLTILREDFHAARALGVSANLMIAEEGLEDLAALLGEDRRNKRD